MERILLYRKSMITREQKEHEEYLEKLKNAEKRYGKRQSGEILRCSKCKQNVLPKEFYDIWDELCFECYFEITHHE